MRCAHAIMRCKPAYSTYHDAPHLTPVIIVNKCRCRTSPVTVTTKAPSSTSPTIRSEVACQLPAVQPSVTTAAQRQRSSIRAQCQGSTAQSDGAQCSAASRQQRIVQCNCRRGTAREIGAGPMQCSSLDASAAGASSSFRRNGVRRPPSSYDWLCIYQQLRSTVLTDAVVGVAEVGAVVGAVVGVVVQQLAM